MRRNLDRPYMRESSVKLILSVNSGSSSLKLALYQIGDEESRVVSGSVVRLGQPGSRLRIASPDGQILLDREIGPADHAAAFQQLVEWLDQHYPSDGLSAVGHRLVHGGRRFAEPALISGELIRSLQGLVSIDPDHTPQSIGLIKLAEARYPRVSQVACFDTAFHRHLP